jgi:peptide/nickel transport system substrate-binding protein
MTAVIAVSSSRSLVGRVWSARQRADRFFRVCLLIIGVCGYLALCEARAATVAIGLASEMRTTDPHRALTQADATIAAHAFEPLVTLDSDSKPLPALATSWVQENDTTWRFILRHGVQFHNGMELTAEDVALSLQRAMKLRPELAIGGNPEWLTATVVDRFTVQLKTAAAYPLLLNDLSLIRIASAKSIDANERANVTDRPLAGTGPYRIAAHDGNRVELLQHRSYWKSPATWDSVLLFSLPDNRERVEALLAARVHAIERIPPEMIERLRSDERASVYQAVSGRLMFLQVGTHRFNAPELTYSDQPSPAPNPLLDRRVRRAISEAIDRRALITSVLRGLGEPAGQLVPAGYLGYVPELHADQRNIDDARALLAESGFPNGFAVTLHGPRDVYPADAEVLAAIARMIRDAGIRADHMSEPGATFAGRAARQQYSAYLRGFTVPTRDASVPLRSLLATRDARTGAGSLNWSGYSNGTLDGLIQRAMSHSSYEARQLLLQEATVLAMKDVALIPLYFAYDTWATGADYELSTRSEGLLMADHVRLRSRSRVLGAAL